MKPEQIPPEEVNNEDILVDATITNGQENNKRLDSLIETNDIQAEGIMRSNEELNELNRTADMMLGEMTKPKPEVQKVEVVGKKSDVAGAFFEMLRGDKGDQGERGEKGDKGDTGDALTFEMLTDEQKAGMKGEKGDQGEKGEKGDKGEKGKDGKDGKGEKGDQGEKGERGEKGEKGKDGSPDTPKQVKEKLLKEGLDYSELKNRPDIGMMIGKAIGNSPASKDYSFLELTDTPETYEGNALKGVRVNAAGTGLEFFTGSGLVDWGEIGGTLSNQTDLQAALDLKANISSLTFTAGSIPFAGSNGLLTQDNASLFFDDTNNRLGIGTNTPTLTLSVKTTGNGTKAELVTSSTSNGDFTGVRFGVTSGDEARKAAVYFERNASNGRGIMHLAVDIVDDSNNVALTDAKISISNIGYVGIGITAPISTLHIYENTASTSTTGGVTIENDGAGDALLQFLLTGDQRWYMGIDNSIGDSFQINNGQLSSTPAIGISSVSKNVGLGVINDLSHTLTIPSSGTGLSVYNTSDQATNFERVTLFWNTNAAYLTIQNGGSGSSARALRIGAPTGAAQSTTPSSYFQVGANIGNRRFVFVTGTETAAGPLISYESGLGGTSVIQNVLSLSPTVSQSSTAGYTVLLINPTESSTGSGAKNLFIGQIGGVEKFSIANTGITTITNTTDQASNQVLVLQGDRATPATNDIIYQSFRMSDSAGNQDEFARISVRADDISSGSEDGVLFFSLVVGGTIDQRLALTSSVLQPWTNDEIALGNSSAAFADLFLASGGVINWNNGNVTLTHASASLTVAGGKVVFATPTTSIASFNLPAGTAPSAPVDGDVWREDNTDTGVKIRVNGVTKTVTLA